MVLKVPFRGFFSLPSVPRDKLKWMFRKHTMVNDPRKTSGNLLQKWIFHAGCVIRHVPSIVEIKKLDKWLPRDLTDRSELLSLNVHSLLLIRCKRDLFFRIVMRSGFVSDFRNGLNEGSL